MVKYDASVSPKLVLIGHSMGGLLAKSLVVDTGTTLWDTVFRVPAATLHAPGPVRRTFEDGFILKPWSSVGLIVFMGTPQHGSDEADGLLGRLSVLPVESSFNSKLVGYMRFYYLNEPVVDHF